MCFKNAIFPRKFFFQKDHFSHLEAFNNFMVGLFLGPWHLITQLYRFSRYVLKRKKMFDHILWCVFLALTLKNI
jgi:hypothetical protein